MSNLLCRDVFTIVLIVSRNVGFIFCILDDIICMLSFIIRFFQRVEFCFNSHQSVFPHGPSWLNKKKVSYYQKSKREGNIWIILFLLKSCEFDMMNSSILQLHQIEHMVWMTRLVSIVSINIIQLLIYRGVDKNAIRTQPIWSQYMRDPILDPRVNVVLFG